jgi:hypothetical protein
MRDSVASRTPLHKELSIFLLTVLAGIVILLLVTKISFMILPGLILLICFAYLILTKTEFGLYLAALTLPLGFLGPISSFNGIITFTRILVGMTLISLLIHIAAGKRKLDLTLARKDLILIIFSLGIVISSLIGIDLDKAATGLFHYANSILMYVIVLLVVRDRKKYYTFILCTLCGLTLALVFGTLSYHMGLQGAEQFTGKEIEGSRMTSTEFLGPNAFAMMLVAIFPFPVVGYFHERRARLKFLYIVWACLVLYGTLITFSRAATVCLGAVALYLFVRFFHRLSRKELVTLAVAGVLILSLLPGVILERVGSLSQGEEDPSIRGRWSYVKVGYEIFKDHPFFGVGPQNYKIAFASPEYRSYGYMSEFNIDIGQEQGRVGRTAHNLYLKVLNEAGLVGFFLILYFFFLTWREFRKAESLLVNRREERLYLCTVSLEVGFLAYLLNSLFLSSEFFPLLWIFIGLATVSLRLAEETQ